MRDMKDSGYLWIGNIPEDWNVSKVKHIFEIGRGRVIAKTELEESGYPVYSSQTKNNGVLGYIKTYDFDRSQLTWTTDGANAGTVFLREGQHNCTNVCGTLMPKNDLNDLRYLKYALAHIAHYHKRADTNGFKIMNNEMAEIEMILPSKSEQEQIVRILDSKSEQIDTLISNQEQQIEKLKAYKQSLITEVVTKGLNPNAPMKDSGVEWIGEIPNSWKMCRIKDLFSLRNERNYEALEDVNLISLYTDKGVVQHKDIIETTGNRAVTADGYKKVYKDDIVVNIILCWMGAVGKSNFDGVTSPAYDVYKPNCNVNSDYYHYLFRTKNFNGECYRYGRGIMMMRWRTYSTEFTAINIPCPSNEEQQEIVAYLDNKCSKIDALIEIKQKKIDKLNEYKKSLIYEYVTGKKEA